ncbi:hypothetical protein V7121_22725 [Neobacillus drentensis]|uniref:hypothetical protein n=1 Tax=Neobacillus drentensis TaxID=220684 RepID=UPI002FFE48C6
MPKRQGDVRSRGNACFQLVQSFLHTGGLGLMTNPTEDKKLSYPVYLKNLLTNIADGFMQYASYKENEE